MLHPYNPNLPYVDFYDLVKGDIIVSCVYDSDTVQKLYVLDVHKLHYRNGSKLIDLSHEHTKGIITRTCKQLTQTYNDLDTFSVTIEQIENAIDPEDLFLLKLKGNNRDTIELWLSNIGFKLEDEA